MIADDAEGRARRTELGGRRAAEPAKHGIGLGGSSPQQWYVYGSAVDSTSAFKYGQRKRVILLLLYLPPRVVSGDCSCLIVPPIKGGDN